jgi:hypothetical protein
MKKFIQLTFILLVIAGVSSLAEAQNTLSEGKRKLIAELIVITKMDKQVNEITDVMLKSMEVTYPIGFQRALENNPNLTPKEREKLAASANESFRSFSKRFRERLPQAINYSQYIEDTVYPLYDKFFSEKELSDLVAFYKSETGKKVIETMPQIYAESTRLAQELLMPKILKLLDELMREDLENLNKSPQKTNK